MEKPILLIYSELTTILENNMEEMEKKLYKINEDSSLMAPIFLYSFAMFQGAIATLMTRFCLAFPVKVEKEIFSNIEKEDLINRISNKVAIENIVEKFVIKTTCDNVEQLMFQINKILGISVMFDSKILNEISETRNCLTHNNRSNK